MRDPGRIEKICDELKELWAKVPDWRLGQLVENAADYNKKMLFYIEDNQLIQSIKHMLKETQDE